MATVPSPCTDCVPLRIPWPDAADQTPDHIAENWKAIERWVTYMIKACLCCNCGGGEG